MSLEKCFGNICPLKNTCIRYQEKEKKGDIFFWKPPYRPETKRCDFYISTADNIWDELNKDLNINLE